MIKFNPDLNLGDPDSWSQLEVTKVNDFSFPVGVYAWLRLQDPLKIFLHSLILLHFPSSQIYSTAFKISINETLTWKRRRRLHK